jgi:hypothetical protein
MRTTDKRVVWAAEAILTMWQTVGKLASETPLSCLMELEGKDSCDCASCRADEAVDRVEEVEEVLKETRDRLMHV